MPLERVRNAVSEGIIVEYDESETYGLFIQ